MGRDVTGRRLLQGLAGLGLLLTVGVVPPAAGADDTGGAGSIAVPGQVSLSSAKLAFEKHSEKWMADLEKGEAENRRKASVYSVASEEVVRFDGYSDDWETQVKPTGSPQTPYVGILRYKEHTYTCMRSDESRCTVTRSVPVSEIFSFRNGRWTY